MIRERDARAIRKDIRELINKLSLTDDLLEQESIRRCLAELNYILNR